jgi:multidrug resistance efflux pump
MRALLVVILTAVLICGGVIGGVMYVARRRAAMKAPRPAQVTLKTQEAMPNGIIRPQHTVSFGADVDGNIELFLVEVGEEVFEGQPLARIGAGNLDIDRQNASHAVEAAQDAVSKAEALVTTAQAEVSRADADAVRSRQDMEAAQRVSDRQSMLFREGATPRKTYEKAVAEFEAAAKEFQVIDNARRAARDALRMAEQKVDAAKKTVLERTEALEAAEQAFQNSEVHSKVEGLLVARKGEVGQPASEAGQDMFTIATDIYALEVAVQPKEEILKNVYPGKQVTVLILDIEGMGIPGEVLRITEEKQVVVQFASSTPAIRPGMRAEVRLQ